MPQVPSTSTLNTDERAIEYEITPQMPANKMTALASLPPRELSSFITLFEEFSPRDTLSPRYNTLSPRLERTQDIPLSPRLEKTHDMLPPTLEEGGSPASFVSSISSHVSPLLTGSHPSSLSFGSFGSFLSAGSRSGLLKGSFASAGSRSEMIKENNTFLCEDSSDANNDPFLFPKNGDGVSTVWVSRDYDSPGTPGGQLNSHQPSNHGFLSQPLSVQSDSASSGVDQSKRSLSTQKSGGSPPKRGKRTLRWTKEEDRRLEEGVKKYGLRNWVLVAKHVMTRDNKMCRQRWSMSLKPEIKVARKGKWTAEEDEQLRQIVSNHTFKNARTWELVSKAMGYNRNIKSIRSRWENYLDPNLRYDPWTSAEDEQLLGLQSKFGNKWSVFTSTLVGRSSDHIRRRCTWLIKQRTK